MSSMRDLERSSEDGDERTTRPLRVLVAYDGRDHSGRVIREVANLALGRHVEIAIISVVPPDARGSKSGGHVGFRPHAHEDVARAHAYLKDRGLESDMIEEHGDPVERIVARAHEGGYDLIAVGSRRLGRLGELVLGGVSHAVLRKALCPVLVVGDDGSERFEHPIGAEPGAS
jgi:nucleotide-binding universal stress UspA family protein